MKQQRTERKELAQAKKVLYYLFFVLLFIVFYIIQDFDNNSICLDRQNKFLEDEYSGEIIGKFLDRENHMHKSVFFISGKDTVTRYFPTAIDMIFENIQYGDSIYKVKGYSEVVLRKLNGEKLEYVADFNCE
jgi:hypothetical protein